MKIITGNLLEMTHGTILHQVNCHGVVCGLAGALQKRWPTAFEEYFAACRISGALMAGDTLARLKRELRDFNIHTQRWRNK